MKLAYLISLWFLASIPVGWFLGKFCRVGRGGERSAVMADSVEKHGVILTFACGPLGSQVVEVNVGAAQARMTLVEFCELMTLAQNALLQRMQRRGLIR